MKLFTLISFMLVAAFNINAQWQEQNSGTTDTLRSVYFINSETGWACGYNGTILHTSNGGDSWNIQNTGINNRLYTIAFRNELNGYAAGVNVMLNTSDGGSTWNIKDTTRTYIKIAIANDTTIWYGGANEVLIRSTPAGGISYTLNIIDSLSWHVFDIAAYENNVVALIGVNTQPHAEYHIFHSSNAGLNWNNKRIGTHEVDRYNKLFYRNNNSVYVGGYRYALNSWTIFATVFFNANFSTKLISGGNTTGPVRGLFFANDSTGWLSNRDNLGKIYKTTNSGEDWFSVGGGLSNNDVYYDIFFADEDTGYAVGTNGKIYKTTTGGVTSIDDEENIVTEFSLNQNYPNPFNPSTKISFAVPENGNVSLKVYNALGEEVAVLLNEELNAGIHEVNFNAAGLSSGVYFYKVTAGKFSETRKMVLLQ